MNGNTNIYRGKDNTNIKRGEGNTNIYRLKGNLYINLACLSVCLFVCLFVCLYPINVKTAEPIGPKFFVGHLGSPGKVYESSKF